MARNLYFLGTAGSGKATMVYAFQMWMDSQGPNCVMVNLDAGADALAHDERRTEAENFGVEL